MLPYYLNPETMEDVVEYVLDSLKRQSGMVSDERLREHKRLICECISDEFVTDRQIADGIGVDRMHLRAWLYCDFSAPDMLDSVGKLKGIYRAILEVMRGET